MISSDKASAAIKKAREEIANENLQKAVDLLKRKLRERETAISVVANIDREIADLELKIEHGNI